MRDSRFWLIETWFMFDRFLDRLRHVFAGQSGQAGDGRDEEIRGKGFSLYS
jgi:hypothetical protein